MNPTPMRSLFLAVCTVGLISCGGADDESGGPVSLNVVPASFGYKMPDGSTGCAAGDFGDIFIINGGSAPYTIRSTSPGVAVPNRSTVNDRGGSFGVTFTGGCTQSQGVTILVVDALQRQFTVTVTNLPAATADAGS